MRHWKGRREAVSQSQLDRLWTPPRFQFAQHYASTLKALSLCLVYAPLYPPAYLITGVLLVFAYACYKGALKMWYHKPRPLKELLCDRMVAFVVWVLLPAHIVVSWDAQNKARQDADSIWSKVHAVFALLLWLGLVIVLHIHTLLYGNSQHFPN